MINEAFNNHTQEEFDNYAKWRQEYITKNKPLIEKYKPKITEWYQKHKELLQKENLWEIRVAGMVQ